LRVLNGTGKPREATDAGAALEAIGFGIDGFGDDPVLGNDRTRVQYPPGQEAAADLVARWLRGGARLEEVDGAAGIVLITGSDWNGVRDTARAASRVEPGDTTATSAGSTPDTSTPSRSNARTTSTTNPAAREC
ncbi:MAG: LytR C-terminal domain-containing protein, partial [Acidimicrobiales bacterium]